MSAVSQAGQIYTSSCLDWLYISISVFPLVKIVMLGQLCQQLIKPVLYTYFYFYLSKL